MERNVLEGMEVVALVTLINSICGISPVTGQRRFTIYHLLSPLLSPLSSARGKSALSAGFVINTGREQESTF